jgi:hypothetical protein
VTTPAPSLQKTPKRRRARASIHEAIGPIGNKETDVLKKTSAYSGLVIATAAGALLTSSPAYAQVDLGRDSSSSSHRHRTHNRNWNGNHNRPRIFIRIYVYNKNNNKAIAVVHPDRDRAVHVLRVPAQAVRDEGITPAGRGAAVTNQGVVPTGQAPATAGQRTARGGQGSAGADQNPRRADGGTDDVTPTS